MYWAILLAAIPIAFIFIAYFIINAIEEENKKK
jgi:hypothetical protein